ncbi:MAG: PAS domain S-box protein [Candidatus Moranbacteria bacterium]|nr:PAS domain S-box protein [Candidatus Moranbacteria bacterium]
MKLRAKVCLIIGSTIVVLLGVSLWIIYIKLEREFAAAQREDAASQIGTSSSIIDRDIQSFSVKLADWAQWDDSYEFMERRNQAYIDSNLNDESLRSLGVQLILFLDNTGEIVFEKQTSIADGKKENETFPVRYLQEETRFRGQQSPFSGLISLDGKIFLLAVRPIVKSNGSGIPRGTLYFGRQLQQEYFDEVGRISRVKLSLQSVSATPMINPEQSDIMRALAEGGGTSVLISGHQEVRVARYFSDIFGNPTFIALLQYDGHIVARGLEASILFGKTGIFLSIMFAVVVFFLIEWLVLRKLLRLETEVKRVADAANPDARVTVVGSDEFASLGGSINDMLVSLRDMAERTRQSEGRFDVIANLAPVMIWMMNVQGEYVYMNKSAMEFVSKVSGKNNWGEAVFLEDIGIRKALIEEARVAKRAFRLEYRIQKKEGGHIWVSESAVPHITTSGKLTGYLGVVTDIHKEKEMQIQSKAFTREIEEMNEIFMAREEKMSELKEEIRILRGDSIEKI